MLTPAVRPDFVLLKVTPGEARTTTVGIAKAPSAATVNASVVSGQSVVSLHHVIAYERIRRPATEEEIAELPAFPPSLRERLRRNGVEETVEFGRAEAGAPLQVPANSIVEFVLQVAAPQPANAGIITAGLVIEGSGWTRTQIPVTVVVGASMNVATVRPAELRRVIEPGETLVDSVVIDRVPSAGRIVAHVLGGGSMLRLTELIVFRPVKRQFTEEEIQELPPYPPSIREDARKYGYVELQEMARAPDGTPLEVPLSSVVHARIEFSAPVGRPSDVVTATLVIEGTTWRRVEVPLALTVGKITAALSTRTLAARQGESVGLNLVLTSVAGPDTEVALALGMGDDQWRVEPSTVHVPRGATVSTALTVRVDPKAPLGTFPVGFETNAFDGLQFHREPLELTVQASRVTARLLQTALVAQPGSTVTCQVEVVSSGGYKVLTLSPTAPPLGVSVNPVSRELPYGASTTVMPVDFVVDSRAPLVDRGMFGIRWSANDGANDGTLFGNLTIGFPPEARTFQYQVTTPAGTALGGQVELTIRSDGTYTFRGDMHGSGLDAYAFRIGVVVRSVDGRLRVAATKSGRVGGAIGSTPRDYHWIEERPSQLIRDSWADLRNGTADFSKWYEDVGALGTLEDIGKAVAEFLVGAVFVNPFVAAAIVVGSELGALSEVPFHHPTIVAGVVVAGGLVLILGPTALIPAVVAGAVVAPEIVQARPLRDPERAVATAVFGDSLNLDRVLVANFDFSGTAFCWPNLDGFQIIGLGDRAENPLATTDRATTLVHELTHAWQLQHASQLAGMVLEAMINKFKKHYDVYSRNPLADVDGRPWSGYSMEHQAQIVGAWFALAAALSPTLDSSVALQHPAFRYIHENIRMGQP